MANTKGGKIETAVELLVKPIVEAKGFRLWDVCFEKEGAAWYLRIFIDRDEGISIDDCESVDTEINELIDKQDFIDSIDILEIGSPGLERVLRKPEHYKACVGKRINVKLYRPIDGMKDFGAVLDSFEDNKLTLEVDGTKKTFALSEIAKIKLDDLDI